MAKETARRHLEAAIVTTDTMERLGYAPTHDVDVSDEMEGIGALQLLKCVESMRKAAADGGFQQVRHRGSSGRGAGWPARSGVRQHVHHDVLQLGRRKVDRSGQVQGRSQLAAALPLSPARSARTRLRAC